MIRYLLPFIGLLLFVGSCAAQDVTATNVIPVDRSYILRSEDVVRLSVFEEPDLTAEVAISKNGEASFPLINDLNIGGLRVSEAIKKISEAYLDGYLRNPRVSLTISKYSTDVVSIIGQVKSPGTLDLPRSPDQIFDLGSALATVGGVTPDADTSNIQLVSQDGTTRVFSLKEIQGKAGRTPLKANDRIIVNANQFIGAIYTVLGQVVKPGQFPVPKSGQTNLATALGLAGGLAELADPRTIKLSRVDGAESVYSIAQINSGPAGKVAVRDGDTINVAVNPFANKQVTMMGQVNKAGLIPFPLTGELDIMTAISMAGGFTDLANPKKVTLSRGGTPYLINTRTLDKLKDKTVWLEPGDVVTVAESIF